MRADTARNVQVTASYCTSLRRVYRVTPSWMVDNGLATLPMTGGMPI